ncbi:hypothetical protein M1E17_22780 [Arthrobacter sp. D1-29]
MKRTSATLAVVGLGLISVTAPASAAPNMVTVCHDGSDTGTGWNPMQFNVNGLNGHDGHPTDIIPPNNSIPGGLNWTNSGKIIYIANCAPLPPGETPPVYPPVEEEPVVPPVEEEPVVPPVEEEPVVPPVDEEPVVPPVDEEPVVPPVDEEPVVPPVDEEPVIPPVDEEPVVPPVDEEPVIPPVDEEPVIPPVDEEPVVPPVDEEPVVPPVEEEPVVPPVDEEPVVPPVVNQPVVAPAAPAAAVAATGIQSRNRGFNAQTAIGEATDTAPTWLGGLGVMVAAVMAVTVRRRVRSEAPAVR